MLGLIIFIVAMSIIGWVDKLVDSHIANQRRKHKLPEDES